MKTNYATLAGAGRKTAFPLFLLGCAGVFAFSLCSQAQVVIEGGPGTVQISDRDGQPEPANSAPDIATTTTFDSNPPLPAVSEAPDAVVVQPVPNSPTTVLVPVEKPKKTTEVKTGVVVDTVPPEKQISVAVARRMQELETELGVADAATTQTISLSTENLFDENGVFIEPIAQSKLALISEYMKLAQPEKVEMTYNYISGELPEDIAWKRSVELVGWLKGMGHTTGMDFEVLQPKIVTQPTPVKDAPEALAMQLRPTITIVLLQLDES